MALGCCPRLIRCRILPGWNSDSALRWPGCVTRSRLPSPPLAVIRQIPSTSHTMLHLDKLFCVTVLVCLGFASNTFLLRLRLRCTSMVGQGLLVSDSRSRILWWPAMFYLADALLSEKCIGKMQRDGLRQCGPFRVEWHMVRYVFCSSGE